MGVENNTNKTQQEGLYRVYNYEVVAQSGAYSNFSEYVFLEDVFHGGELIIG